VCRKDACVVGEYHTERNLILLNEMKLSQYRNTNTQFLGRGVVYVRYNFRTITELRIKIECSVYVESFLHAEMAGILGLSFRTCKCFKIKLLKYFIVGGS